MCLYLLNRFVINTKIANVLKLLTIFAESSILDVCLGLKIRLYVKPTISWKTWNMVVENQREVFPFFMKFRQLSIIFCLYQSIRRLFVKASTLPSLISNCTSSVRCFLRYFFFCQWMKAIFIGRNPKVSSEIQYSDRNPPFAIVIKDIKIC